MSHILIIGCGLAGVSAAIRGAELKHRVTIVAQSRPDRSKSVLAAGGINAALNTKDQSESPAEHAEDTLRAGVLFADPAGVSDLTAAAPEIVLGLAARGIIFSRDAEDRVDLRAFGGQKKIRTAFSRSGIGRQLIAGLSAKLLRHEATGSVQFLDHHQFLSPVLHTNRCVGAVIEDATTGDISAVTADAVIAASGGLGGLFPKHTGSLQSDGSVSAALFRKGVGMANLEMIQYHPTTVETPAKHMLISESARGEGGRLFTFRNGELWYFMDEWYSELGSLMPRDVVSRAIHTVCHDLNLGIGGRSIVGLQLEHLPPDIFDDRLKEIADLCRTYLHLDPATAYIPLSPAVHYFMGGVLVDRFHRTFVPGLYAAGECACQYHGANRLGGNSTLGAIYGGRIAAAAEVAAVRMRLDGMNGTVSVLRCRQQMQEIMGAALGIVRDSARLTFDLAQLAGLRSEKVAGLPLHGGRALATEDLIDLGDAMIRSALTQKESRGAHCRSDHPDRNDAQFCKITLVQKTTSGVSLRFAEIGGIFS